MKKLRVAVVGSGVGTGHVESYQQLPEMYEVAALCDIDATRGKALAAKHNIPQFVTKLDDLFKLQLDLIDFVEPVAGVP